MELKPCPFCGEAAMVVKTHKGAFAVGCNNSHCRGDWVISKCAKDENVAVEAWNTRAELTCELECTIYWASGCTAYWQHELSCGHTIETLDKEPPSYCSECGRRITDVRQGE